MSEREIEAIIEKKLDERKPHVCPTCRFWFKLRIPDGMPYPAAGQCMYPGTLQVKGQQCLCWEGWPKKEATPAPNPDDEWEKFRSAERNTFGIDIGAGSHKLLPVGFDVRPVTDVQGDAKKIPFGDKHFVIAVLRCVLEHVDDWQAVLKEAERVAEEVYVFHTNKETWDGKTPWFPLPPRYRPIRQHQYSTLYKLAT